ncbi:hypothetical protein [Dactylosporangium sp. CA-233914]|uniref:hypothetical protein n=1 Tax=Dactylosporangium sp. CA-233914 TaxID=3239934 RepID=UPI003D941DC7
MSRYEAESAPESNRSVTVVMLSVLILTVIGALFGYVLGLRDIDEDKSAAGDGPSAGPTGVTSAGGSRQPASTPQNCPAFIGAGAQAQDPGVAVPLKLVQYIRTDSKKEAWICQESDGSGLWYQGHDMKRDWADGGEIPEEGENGLLRPGVVAKGRSWSVTNLDTTYTVTPKALTVTGKQTSSYIVIQANPPA